MDDRLFEHCCQLVELWDTDAGEDEAICKSYHMNFSLCLGKTEHEHIKTCLIHSLDYNVLFSDLVY